MNHTDENFWNSQWSRREKSSKLINFLQSGKHGKNGYFILSVNKYLPEIWDGANVIELGGGGSQYLTDLAIEKKSKVSAIDNSEIAIGILKELYSLNQVHGEIIIGDVFNIENYKVEYDVVTHFGLAEHFDSPKPLLEIAYGILKPGGTLFFTVPNLSSFGAKIWEKLSPLNFNNHVLHTDSEIFLAADEVGFLPGNKFWFGPPLLRMCPPENNTVFSQLISFWHAILLLLGKIFKGIYSKGHPKISSNRAFYFTKPL